MSLGYRHRWVPVVWICVFQNFHHLPGKPIHAITRTPLPLGVSFQGLEPQTCQSSFASAHAPRDERGCARPGGAGAPSRGGPGGGGPTPAGGGLLPADAPRRAAKGERVGRSVMGGGPGGGRRGGTGGEWGRDGSMLQPPSCRAVAFKGSRLQMTSKCLWQGGRGVGGREEGWVGKRFVG